jgi:GNAT superfamily N-acetyltransferase
VESEFNARWPWPRDAGFVGDRFDDNVYLVALDADGTYLGHCYIRQSPHAGFRDRDIPEISDLNVMPDSRRRGAATALLDLAEAVIASTSPVAGIGVGLYDDYGPAQRLYAARGYVLDGTGAWAGSANVRGGDVVTADDDLVLYMTKRVAEVMSPWPR